MKKLLSGITLVFAFVMMFTTFAFAESGTGLTVHYTKDSDSTTGAMEDSVFEPYYKYIYFEENEFKKTGYDFDSWKVSESDIDSLAVGTILDDAGLKAIVNSLSEEDSKSISVVPTWKLKSVDIKSIEPVSSGVMITWSKNSAASGYVVYKAYSGQTEKIDVEPNTSYTDNAVSNGVKYTYAVAAKAGETDISEKSNKQSITFLSAPKIKTLKEKKVQQITITYSKNKQAKGYEIEASTSKKFTNPLKYTIKKNSQVKEILRGFKPKKTYYVRVRSYKGKNYSAWSASKKIKTKKATTVDSVKYDYAMSADVALTGSGSGYHAKLVLVTPTSAVSYGIQYDTKASAPYGSRAMAMLENVRHNGAGGQDYVRFKELSLKKSYNLMVALNKNGSGALYVDGKKVGTFSNPNLANQQIYFRVEGAARLNGDSVNATFQNIRVRKGKKAHSVGCLTGTDFKHNGIKIKDNKTDTITISGKLNGAFGDWDVDFEGCSSVRQFLIY